MNFKRIILSMVITSSWLLFALHVAVLPSVAGDWRVSPLKVELSEKIKTGIFRVNNDGDHDLRNGFRTKTARISISIRLTLSFFRRQ